MARKRNSRQSSKQARTSEPASPLSHKDELRELLEHSIEQVLDNVDKFGWCVPFCLAHSQKGERIYVLADSSDPNAEYEPQKYIDSILAQVRRMIENQELRAVAFARNVNVTVGSDQGPRESAAVKVVLDHQAGSGTTAYLLYHMEDRATPDELFYEDLAERFFPS